MPDREKVIKGLEICSELGSWHGLDCKLNETYKDCPYRGCETGCVVTIAKDAIILLKEQEEIIRCKECKHRQNMTASIINGQVCFWCEKTQAYRPDGWYCADGERR